MIILPRDGVARTAAAAVEARQKMLPAVLASDRNADAGTHSLLYPCLNGAPLRVVDDAQIRHGHDAGDALLFEISARLRRVIRADDQVARLGGDEFAIILQDADNADEIRRICTRIADSFANEVRFIGKRMTASTSVGVAVFPEDGDLEESLYKSADFALYEAKRGGRNTSRTAASISE